MPESEEVILVKLGGSIITDKKGSEPVLNDVTVDQLCQEIYKARETMNTKIILGHGAGSFGHPPAAKYRTIEGLVDDGSLMGAAEVKLAMTEMSALMIKKLFQAGVPAIALPPMAFLTSQDKNLDQLFLNALVNLLQTGFVPVIHGDVVTDGKLGFTIFSGERILNLIAVRLREFGLSPKLVIEVGETAGVYYDLEAKDTIPLIDKTNFNEIEENIGGSSGIDVTGGMGHKVREAYKLAQKGIPTLLISAQSDNLRKAILGKEVLGTWVRY